MPGAVFSWERQSLLDGDYWDRHERIILVSEYLGHIIQVTAVIVGTCKRMIRGYRILIVVQRVFISWNAVQEWSFMRILNAWVSLKNRAVLQCASMLLPGVWGGVSLPQLLLFMGLYGKQDFVTCSLSMWLNTLPMWFFLTFRVEIAWCSE